MSNRSKSYKNLLYSILSQVLTIALGLLLPRLFVISYGSEVNGLLTSLNQLLVYLALFEAGVGAATMQALYGPVARSDWDSINGVLAATNRYYRRTGRWYFAVLVLVSVLYPLVVETELSFFTVCGAVFFSGIGNVVLYYFQGKYSYFLQAEGKGYISTNLTTIIHTTVSLSKAVLILLGADIVVILAVSFLINCLQAVYMLRYVRRHYPQVNLDVPPDYGAISQKNYAMVHQVSTLIFNNTDVLILTMACGLKVVSVYSMFKLVTSHLEAILNIPMNSIRFILGQTYQTNRERYILRIDLVESYFSAVTYALFAVALFLFLPFMRMYTAGVTDINYVDGKLAVLFVVVSLLNKSRAPMCETVNYAGHYQQTASRSILESAINLAVSLVGVYACGIYGVLLGTVFALAYRTNDFILYANHKLLERSARRTYSIYLVNIVQFVLIQLVFRRFFAGPIESWFDFIKVGALSAILSLTVFIGSQTLLFPHCRKKVLEILRTRRLSF